MKFRWEKKYLYWGLTAFFVIVLSISFFVLLFNFKGFCAVLNKINQILMPFIVGFVFAYLLCPIMTFFEKKCLLPLLKKMNVKKINKKPRVLAITLTILLTLAFFTGLLSMVLPQLKQSIEGIIDNSSLYINNLQKWTDKLLASNETLQKFLTDEFNDINEVSSNWAKNNLLPHMNNILSGLTSGVIDMIVFLKNIFVGLIISIYVLYSKEMFFAQTKKVLYALFPIKGVNRVVEVTRRSHKVFGGFIVGKLIDSLIIGLLCFVGMSIFNMPYPVLISVIIGVTNVIPFFGPFIGAVPSALLILMIDPLTCLYFVIFVLALQQFDGNILGPRILGDSTGLSAFWVIFAILLSGGLFGFIGMVIGVPAFAVIYTLIVEFIEKKLKKHELPVETKVYHKLSSIDFIDNQPVYDDADIKIVDDPNKIK